MPTWKTGFHPVSSTAPRGPRDRQLSFSILDLFGQCAEIALGSGYSQLRLKIGIGAAGAAAGKDFLVIKLWTRFLLFDPVLADFGRVSL
jgi:hypothetical protein